MPAINRSRTFDIRKNDRCFDPGVPLLKITDEAEAVTPPSKTQMARTVGLPRLSRISRPKSLSILGMGLDTLNELMYQIDDSGRRIRDQLQNYKLLSFDLLRSQVLQSRLSGDPS
jgi:hypothetical protein